MLFLPSSVPAAEYKQIRTALIFFQFLNSYRIDTVVSFIIIPNYHKYAIMYCLCGHVQCTQHTGVPVGGHPSGEHLTTTARRLGSRQSVSLAYRIDDDQQQLTDLVLVAASTGMRIV